jgi:Na+/melibiose symporter-like transporter
VAGPVLTPRLGRPYWRLLAASSVSNLADGVARVALPLLATTLTRDPLLIAGLTTLAFLPWLLFALVSGALVDRVDRARAMAAANLLRAALVGGLGAAAVLDAVSIGLLYAVAFGAGVAETVYDSAARAALPQVVRRDQLDTGNSLLATGEVVGQSFLGAPVGSVLFAALAAAPLLATAGGYVLAAVLVLGIGLDLRPVRAGRTSVRADIRAGMRWIWAHDLLRGLTLLTAVSAVGLYMTYGVLVLYVLDTLGLSERAFGLLFLAAGGGAALGGVAAPWLGRRLGRTGGLVGAALLSALATAAMGLTRAPLLAGALFALAALAGTVWDVLAMSLRQALVPHELFGRVQGSYRTLVWGAIPVGAAAGGALAGLSSVPVVFVVGGLVHILAGVAVWRLLRRHRRDVDALFDTPGSGPVPAPER